MRQINIHIIPVLKAKKIGEFPFEQNFLSTYEIGRGPIFEEVDIFTKNIRSQGQDCTNFKLFNQVDNPAQADAVIFPFPLELYESIGREDLIYSIIESVCSMYSSTTCVFTWNSDKDFARYTLPDVDNFKVINYNTSQPKKSDILVPFWVMDTTPISSTHQYTFGFIGSITHTIRQMMVQQWANVNTCLISLNRFSLEEYRKLSSLCMYSLCPRGAGLNSWRFYEMFHVGSIPILFANDSALPYRDFFDYNDVCFHVEEDRITDVEYVVNKISEKPPLEILKNIEKHRWLFSLKGVQYEVWRQLAK